MPPRRVNILGRRPITLSVYVARSQAKIEKLNKLSLDKDLTSTERKRFRSQKYALQKRVHRRLRAQ